MLEGEKTIAKRETHVDCTFETLGAYNWTYVNINIKIPFKKLHLLFNLPLFVLKKYWSSIIGRNDEVSLNDLTEFHNSEDHAISIVKKATPKFTTESEFPHIEKYECVIKD